MTKGRSIRMFLVDGTPTGIITAEIMNWTGHLITAPRSRLADLIQRPEAGRTGVYFLTGTDPEGGFKPLVYLGESDSVGKRLAQHNKDESKEFFDKVTFITSKDQNLTKAHVRFLESRLISIAAEASRAKLVNGTAPEFVLLPEADISDMEFFIEQIRIILPVIGLEFLRSAPRVSTPQSLTPTIAEPTEQGVVYELTNKKLPGLRAEAREVDGDFIVLAGSLARGDGSQSTNQYRKLRDSLKSDAILVQEGQTYRFVQDTAFKSPSAASAVILDRSDNGRATWTLKGTNKSYADVQNEQIAAAAKNVIASDA